MFLNQGLVRDSYQRLAPSLTVGKSHLERTSCLMYFLASDAVSARSGEQIVDLDPNSETGKASRRLMDAEFSRLVLVSSSKGLYKQVVWLGEVGVSDRSPSMKIASNFYSVPLKNAATSATGYTYPRRPNKPILMMGEASTALKWGVMKHPDWKTNVPVMFEHSSSSTPFTDLAVFILRDSGFAQYGGDYCDVFEKALSKRFSIELVSYWIKKIHLERVFASHMINVFSDISQDSQIQDGVASCPNGSGYAYLFDHINYLENLLRKNGVSFDAFKEK